MKICEIQLPKNQNSRCKWIMLCTKTVNLL
uniref:Uncharacterized protein n=1 Tax=Arundo donax TaxID=35708 RepID=A0A0A9HC38_ARUDO